MGINTENNLTKSKIFTNADFVEKGQYKPSVLERHISWLRQSNRSLIQKVGIVALATLEFLALSATGLGLIVVAKALSLNFKLKNIEKFYQTVSTRSPPPTSVPLYDKTSTFNHLNEYVIHDKIIWYKHFNKDNVEWKPVYFDGFPDRIPCEIKSDGCNLVVTDDLGDVHYKKVLIEERDPKTEKYHFVDVTEDNDWIEMWYSFPIIHNIANIFWGKRLRLDPENYRGWAISHRGEFNHYYEDGISKKCYAPVGTTSLYALSKDGRSLTVFDPWCPRSADMMLPLPESKDTCFEGVAISAASATVMVLGYEHTKGSNEKKLKAYTWFVDIDTMGWNPGFSFDYACNTPNKKTPVIPLEGWREHTLPGQVTGNIQIVQTGRGNNARMMMIQGFNKEGEQGHFWKKISDSEWSFQKGMVNPKDLLKPSLPVEADKFSSPVADYTGHAFHGKKKSEFQLKLEGFGGLNYQCTLNITDGKGSSLPLIFNKRKTIQNFMGGKGHLYEIAYPDPGQVTLDPEMEKALKEIFNGKKVIKVKVSEDKVKGTLQLSAGKTVFNLQRS